MTIDACRAPRPRLATYLGEPVIAWSDQDGVFIVPADEVIVPAADHRPVVADPPVVVRTAEPRPAIPAAELSAPPQPTWWRAWCESFARGPVGHMAVLLGAGLLSIVVLMAGGLL